VFSFRFRFAGVCASIDYDRNYSTRYLVPYWRSGKIVQEEGLPEKTLSWLAGWLALTSPIFILADRLTTFFFFQ
jgi:hypothetical protein